jgi:hypothetical protein
MTTEELLAAGLPTEPEVREPELPDPPKMRPLLLLADLAIAKMGRLGQRKKISKISTLT